MRLSVCCLGLAVVCCLASVRADDSPASPAAGGPDALPTESLPSLPRAVASFGAARLGGAVYVYGGSTGPAHAYDDQSQDHTLRRLDLTEPTGWVDVLDGPRLQGNALVAVGGGLVQLGGFTAANPPGEANDLHSRAGVSRWRPGDAAWTALPDLPEPRSSFDAAVIGRTVYVVGGWNLRGNNQDAVWHATGWKLDLGEETPAWRPIADVPEIRRAVATVAYEGRVFLIGGMRSEGGPTTRVDVYDPATDAWTGGPALPGDDMEGFGAAACVVGERLIVSTHRGRVLVLATDGRSWEPLGTVDPGRFFHRMLATGPGEIVLIGGASMTVGKFDEVVSVRLPGAMRAVEDPTPVSTTGP